MGQLFWRRQHALAGARMRRGGYLILSARRSRARRIYRTWAGLSRVGPAAASARGNLTSSFLNVQFLSFPPTVLSLGRTFS